MIFYYQRQNEYMKPDPIYQGIIVNFVLAKFERKKIKDIGTNYLYLFVYFQNFHNTISSGAKIVGYNLPLKNYTEKDKILTSY